METEVDAIIARGFANTATNRAIARSHVRKQLLAIQKKKIDEIIDKITEAYNISSNAITEVAVDSYLSSNHTNAERDLFNQIVSGII